MASSAFDLADLRFVVVVDVFVFDDNTVVDELVPACASAFVGDSMLIATGGDDVTDDDDVGRGGGVSLC